MAHLYSTPLSRYGDIAVVALALLVPSGGSGQLAAPCDLDSPERRGGVGCTVIERRSLPDDLGSRLLWHIDRLEALGAAQSEAGPASVAFEAAGTAWLSSIEPDTVNHHGGDHVAGVGPLELPEAPRYAMQIQVAAFAPGMFSVVHHHSGVEAIYVIEGEACYETPTRAWRLNEGETLAIAGGTLHRAVATGSAIRHVFAVIVHDADQPATMAMAEGSQTQLTPCR